MADEQTTLPLIRTKLHRLPVIKDHLHRERLLDRLEKNRQRPLTLVSAPAGYGKSALLSCWLYMLQDEIYVDVAPWLTGTGDPVALMHKSLDGLVRVCYERGPFLRAISDAATTDKRIEKAWREFLGQFDEAGCARIKADQEQGLIPDFDPRPVAFALNRLNAYTIIDAFGQHPRSEPEPVREALARIWASSLYGIEWLASRSSDLVRT